MTPENFSWHNRVFARGQAPYLPLSAHLTPGDSTGRVTTCWRLSLLERLVVLLRGRVWHQALTFNEPLQPVKLAAREPSS